MPSVLFRCQQLSYPSSFKLLLKVRILSTYMQARLLPGRLVPVDLHGRANALDAHDGGDLFVNQVERLTATKGWISGPRCSTKYLTDSRVNVRQR